MQLRMKRRIGILLVVTILLISSFLSYVYLNDRPGGFSDQRISKLLGMDETIHIPTGKTPEIAIQKFRSEQYTSQFIHRRASGRRYDCIYTKSKHRIQ